MDDGPGVVYAYDKMGRLVTVKDPEGNEIRHYEYDKHGQVPRETDGEGKEKLYEYNGLGQITRQRISARWEADTTYYRVMKYSYDQQGNKIEEAYGKEETERDAGPSEWLRIQFSYDKNTRLSQVEDKDRISHHLKALSL